MPLREGDMSPEFTLKMCPEGEHTFSPEKGHSLLVFYKVSCPTCQLTLPFIEKLYKSYGARLNFLGISQDNCPDTLTFAREYGLTFPQVSDDPDYEVSIKYDVQVVPTIFLIDPSGKVSFVEEGFVKSSLESLSERLARLAGTEVNPLFEDVSVPAFKAG